MVTHRVVVGWTVDGSEVVNELVQPPLAHDWMQGRVASHRPVNRRL
jgi:hypothetical protein